MNNGIFLHRSTAATAVSTVLTILIVSGCKPGTESPVFMTGMVETTEIDVAAKVPGRIAELRVREGDPVRAGDTIALLESRELDAKVGQARGALDAARAKSAMANRGLRPQEKDAAEKLFQQAKAQADLMEKTWTRIQKLSQDSVVSPQERDQVEAQYIAARENMAAAQAKLSMAREGSRIEDRAAAVAFVNQAEQAYGEAIAWRDERVLVSPVAGEVAKKILNRGEMAGAGAPVVTVVDPHDVWVVLTVKETDMNRFRMGAAFSGRVPALADTAIALTVAYIAPMGEFASWRPTSQKGGFDIKTFEVHLRPVSYVNGLRAGMSVNVGL
jgi:HlyD family secretion protein